jgi:glucokinase
MAVNETLAIGIDIGATNTKVGLVCIGAPVRILEIEQFPTDLRGKDPTSFLAQTNAIVERYAGGRHLQRIGVALCSLINADRTGAFLSVNAPALNHLNMKATLEGRFDCPVQVMNDVNAYALAEYVMGAGQGTQRLLCLALGTGVAIACLHQGQPIETWAGVPADAARIILDPAAEVTCKAHVRGSAEALCGTANIVRLAERRYGTELLTPHEVITAAREGDPRAGQVMAEIGRHVGHLLALLSPVFFPQRILLTGGTAEAGEPLLQAVRKRYAQMIGDYMSNLALLETGTATPVEIVKGALGPEAAVIGAVLPGAKNPHTKKPSNKGNL